MFDKFVKCLPIDVFYLGYRVRKDTLVDSRVQDGSVKSDAFINTYVSDLLFIYTKDGDSYYDVKLKKIIHEVDVKDLCTLHLDYSDNYLNRDDYEKYSKNDLFGVYGLMSLASVIESINNSDSLNDKPTFKYDDKYGLLLMEVENFVRAINKYLGAGDESLLGPIIKKDELDTYKADFNSVEEFSNLMKGKNALQVKEFIKNLNRQKK